MEKTHRSLHRNQHGIVSFFVVVIIMIVLSLIVLAFAQLVRREQRQSLDRQLSTQAFYAAESGVNDALDALPAMLAAGTTWDQNDCDGFITAADPDLDPDLGNGISYSCLLVDPSPPELNYGSIATDQSQVAPIQSGGGETISVLEISWDDPDNPTDSVANCPQGTNSFPGGYNGACGVGALRLELVPFTGSRTRNQLIDERFIAFIQPRSAGGIISLPYTSGRGDQQGVKAVGGCAAATAPRCTMRITGLASLGSNLFYLRMRSMYRPTDVRIRAYQDAAATDRIDLVGAQIEIDVTGRANDVLRRIKVSRPLDTQGTRAPEFAAQSADTLCKRFSIAPAAPGGSHLLDWYDGVGATDDECNPGN